MNKIKKHPDDGRKKENRYKHSPCPRPSRIRPVSARGREERAGGGRRAAAGGRAAGGGGGGGSERHVLFYEARHGFWCCCWAHKREQNLRPALHSSAQPYVVSPERKPWPGEGPRRWNSHFFWNSNIGVTMIVLYPKFIQYSKNLRTNLFYWYLVTI